MPQDTTLHARNANSDDQFGYSVSVDGNRAIVGAPFEDGDSNAGSNRGAAYVFEQDGTGTWTLTDTLRASNASDGAEFGYSVSIDRGRAIVGARLEDGAAESAGAAYVYERGADGWPDTETNLLRASNAGSGDEFGTSVAIHGDSVVVGAPLEDGGGTEAGAAYVFEREGGAWSEVQILRASNAGANDEFGEAVSLSGSRAIVGARQEDGAANDAGAAYIFERGESGWPATETQILRASNAGAGDRFGVSVAIDQDSALVGARFEDGASDGTTDAGAAYVFGRESSGNWSETQVLRASNAGSGDRFGTVTAIGGDRAIVGAPLEDGSSDGNADAGAAYIFKRESGGWPAHESALFRPTNGGSGDEFGFAVGIGGNRALAGAPREDGASNLRTNAGAVYVNNSLTTPSVLDDKVRTLEKKADQTRVLDNDSPGIGNFDSSSVQVETPPPNGTATANADGSISYTPNDGFIGTDSYTYSAANENGNRSSEATVTVTVLTDAYRAGRAAVFDGNGDFVQMPDDPAINSGGPYETRTIELWFKAGDVSESTEQVLYEEGDDETGLNLYLKSGTLYAGGWDGTNGWAGDWLSTTSIQSNTWHHVALVFDEPEGALRAYLDGRQFGSVSPGSKVSGHPGDIALAASFEDTKFSGMGAFIGEGKYFTGRVDQLRLWTGALTESQVRARAKRVIDRSSAAADSLILEYRLDTGSGTTSFDYATADGAAQDGTFAGNPQWAEFSGAQFGDVSLVRAGGGATLGPAGGSVDIKNVSTTGDDALQVYQYGRTNGPVLTSSDPTEDFSQISDNVSKRLNVVWGLDAVGSSPSADVTVDYSNVQGLSDPSTVRLLKRGGPGQPWKNVSDDWTWDSDAQTFSKSGVSSFSQYAIGEASSPLPVEMVSFEATRTEAGIRLAWKTASEQNNAGFRVQRKLATGGAWTTIGRREGAGTTAESQSYQFTDEDPPFASDSLSYRLRQVDLDGTTHVADAITVSREGVQRVVLRETYPNPARGPVTVRFAVPRDVDGKARLTLYDVLGREVRTVATGSMEGRQTRRLDVSDLSSGVYLLRLSADGTTRTRRLTVVK